MFFFPPFFSPILVNHTKVKTETTEATAAQSSYVTFSIVSHVGTVRNAIPTGPLELQKFTAIQHICIISCEIAQ